MSFPRYAEYKESGVEWLGEVPEHWTVAPLKRIGKFKGGAGFPHEHQGNESEELPFYKVGSLSGADANGVLGASENTVSREVAADLGAFIFPEGTIVFAKVGAALMLGRIRTTGAPACLDNNMMGLLVQPPRVSAFVVYAMHLVRFDLIANPGAVPSLSEGQIGEFSIPVPSIAEQTAIAAFLDRETGKIDALVAEQEKLIALLKEKRQAVISHAVTKGLNPDAPMKDSGIEWLGQVPAHWKVCKLKQLAKKITDGAHISPETEGGIFDFVSTKDLSEDGIDFDGALKTSSSSFEYLERTGCRPQVGDVLFSKDGTIGRTVVVQEDRPFVVASSLIIIRPDPEMITSEFLDLQCKADTIQFQVNSYVKGAGLPRLSIQNLLKIFGAFPPLNEQVQISSYLRERSEIFNKLIREANRATELLKERRSALISAAVTGHIDVRGLA